GATAAPPDDSIRTLIRQLGSDDFDQREDATKRLREIGEPALDALREAMRSDNAEVRRRATDIFGILDHQLYGQPMCLTGHESGIWMVCISADGKRLLTCSNDRTLRVWDVDTAKCLHVLTGHTEGITGAALSPDGLLALSACADRTVRLWDATTGKELLRMTGH